MPNYFTPTLRNNPTLMRKEQFLAIDIELCKLLGKPVDDTYWVNQWVDTIGLSYALGRTGQQIIDELKSNTDFDTDEYIRTYRQEQIAIVQWLEANCIIDCGYSPVK